jgi:hypothetical protein
MMGPGPGKRRGGRPVARLPQDVIDRLGPPPTDDPLAGARWLSSLLLELIWLECQGQAPDALGQRIRATAGAAVRAMPDHVRALLDARLRGEADGEAAEAPGQAAEAIGTGPATVRG